MKTYFYEGPEDFKLISQKGVQLYMFKEEPNNSIWDSRVSDDGTLYLSLSSELMHSGYARLYSFDYKTNTAQKCIEVEKVILPQERAIRASKFHTSISFLNDGNMAMTTHTTDKAPQHPTWLPEAFYGHIWEGFAGSHIVKYNPKTKETWNLGIPVPRESLYGSIYDSKHNALYSMGFIRGHLYRYSFDEKTVKDLGQVSEGHSFRLVLGPDDNIYSSSRSGYMFKIDTNKQKIIDMNYRLPFYEFGDYYKFEASFGNIADGRIGPDGRLYFSVMYGPDIITLDTKTGEFENLGPYLPTPRYAYRENRNGIFGFEFDKKGVLWYFVHSCCNGMDPVEPAQPCGLFRWDITRGGSPEFIGMLGTKDRVFFSVSELYIHNNTMLIVETNHANDSAAVMSIDLEIFEPSMFDEMKHIPMKEIKDTVFHPDSQDSYEPALLFDRQEIVAAANPHMFQGDLINAFRIWRELAPNEVENASVQGLAWDNKNVLHGICGKEKQYAFKIQNNEKISIDEICRCDFSYQEWLKENIKSELFQSEIELPSYPGRQYLAKASASAELSEGRVLIGTQDGFLAILGKDLSVYSLGMTGYNGPVRALSSTPDKKKVYGVAGDENDLGMVFVYDDERGLQLKGNIKHVSSRQPFGSVANNVYSSCCVSSDGKYLAIGSSDRLATVYIYKIYGGEK